ncbi:hypothetical protein BKA67DRAFT_657629 [Truncatella angustata]|uniref:Uncharacterized protein n=1 Tax=Truncatella angustata TaxID=152316 RepID=A0A9P8UP80_9PEZI|nr:uncharacterized protein BKA67DRAFT_657629 [Truncatella angustata]KAH6655707.1 hypothetical protein BKA67DRAFT_657629 [Truncatella angustata]KAH8201899.1 hypothetical protein TruAng_003891 [Truncatella angustata]
MGEISQPAPLTLENLKAISSPAYNTHCRAPASSVASEEDAASLFSDSRSVLSSTSSAPEDEDAPFTVRDASGEIITVYSSLEQAVRHSLLRAEQERRAEEEARQFAYAPLLTSPRALEDVAATSTSLDAAMVGAGYGGEDMDDDEDAYFSMG